MRCFNRNQLFVVPVLDLARAPRRATTRPRVRRALGTRMSRKVESIYDVNLEISGTG